MKLHIYASGDESVGVPSARFDIECPFEREEFPIEDEEAFKKQMLDIYADFIDTKASAYYDYEILSWIED